MKKKWLVLLLIPVFVLTSCGKKNASETTKASSEPSGMVIKTTTKKRSDVINNILVGNSKISFNNVKYDMMSDGEFKQHELWGTFEAEGNKNTYIQLDAFDNQQPVYGELSGYELDGVKWDEAEAVQYLNLQEEALQYSKDGKVLMYKARTGDLIFSVTMFGKKKLAEEEVLELKALAKGIKIEYVENQINPG